ncbi:MAG TPA: single-stranded-DNA-specific exonuclease RecJ, partial [Pseudomonadales bacterium]|nr:single-stranded-DNA-specific exonuclease RecJ [Pseudomonadales bacterium]
MKIRRRSFPSDDSPVLLTDLPPLLQRIYAQRGIRHAKELDLALTALLNPTGLMGLDQAVTLLFS